MRVSATIAGLQQALAANQRILAALRPDSDLGQAVQFATAAAQRAAIGRTPVDTGAWRASHRASADGRRGRVWIDPGARNPRSGAAVATYAAIWDARGGQRAVYARVVQDDGQRIITQAGDALMRSLP